MPDSKIDVAIVGGGLAGLALAEKLEGAGVDYVLLEARDRWGGRIKTFSHGTARYDLGPSWFWPIQPRMMQLVQSLNLRVFDQYAEGELLFEDDQRQVHRGMGYASMAGSLRLAGGMTALVEALVAKLPNARLQLRTPVQTLHQDGRLTTADGRILHADHIVLALPPRLIDSLQLLPPLTDEQRALLTRIPTWMAGQAKFVAVYDQPFWRRNGLSGDAMSRSGPLVEIHDASPLDGTHGALFGFVGVPTAVREHREAELIQAALAQLGRLFGPRAINPLGTHWQDWAREAETASQLDHLPSSHHPDYGLPAPLASLWSGRLLLGASETASQFGGYLEGALERAEILARQLAQVSGTDMST